MSKRTWARATEKMGTRAFLRLPSSSKRSSIQKLNLSKTSNFIDLPQSS